MADDLKTKRIRKSEAGMTLMELIVVMIVIGMLAAVAGPKIYDQMGKSKKNIARLQINEFESMLGIYSFDVGRFPTTYEGLHALIQNPTGINSWDGPYMKNKQEVPLDPWSRPYIYKSPGENGADYDICSAGADGVEGTSDDICSWH